MILVTGGTGFIGGHLVERLAASGAAVRCLVRRDMAFPARVEAVRGDLVTAEGLERALRGTETIFHLAGITKARTPGDYYRGNVSGTENLLRAGAGCARFVHVSSLAAAGPSTADAPLHEDSPARPVSHYGRSKLQGEQAVLASALSARAVIVRPPVVYGPRDRDVFQVLRGISRGWMPRIGRERRLFSFIYVADLIEGIMAAARCPAAGGRTYYLAHPDPSSWEEFAAAACEIIGRKARTLSIPPAAALVAGFGAEIWSRIAGTPGILSRDKVAEACCSAWTCVPDRAREELGFTAQTPLAAGLRETLAWYRRAGWLRY